MASTRSTGSLGSHGRTDRSAWLDRAAGSTQVLAARANHPALKAWFPAFTTLDIRDGWAYEGDAFCLGFNLSWIIGLAMRDRRTTDITPLVAAMERWCETVKRPITDHPELAATPAGWVYQRWIDERDNATYWKAISGRGVDDVSAPAVQIGGWFDLFATGTFDLHQELARGVAGSQHRLIIGPWDHSALPPGTGAGDSDFGPLAGFDLVGAHRQWFDWLLREESEPDWPAARTFLTGWNRWTAWSAWPPPGTAQAWYLQPNGQLGPGVASPATDHFLTDANDPTPTVGGRLCCAPYLLRSGQYDQSARSARPDVRSYVSEPLEADLLVAGPVNAAIWSVSSSAAADIHVTLSDIQPDGRALYLADGICRQSQLDMEAVCFDVRLGQIGHAFSAGHRIQVDIAGMSFPRFDRIPETGTTARSILLGHPNPSQITLPIVQ